MLPHREAFYGGAAGGGKSDALLRAGLQYADVPGYAGIIFRRSYTDLALPGALMDRAREWLGGSDAHWSEIDKTWTFPAGGSLTFAYLASERDRFRYQSSEFQYIAFDEVTQFTELQYTYLFSRLRRLEGVEIPLRMRCAGNPGGLGHEWVKRRFVDPGDPERPFIPARLEDNPYLDRVEYELSLELLDPITKAQLRWGDWRDLSAGKLFRARWFPVVEAVPNTTKLIRAWDLAATAAGENTDPDWTAGVLAGRDHRGYTYIVDVVRDRLDPGGVEELISSTASRDGRRVTVWMEQEPGSSGKVSIDYYRRLVLDAFDFHGQRSTGDKVVRARPFSGQAKAGNVRLVRGDWNQPYLDELALFPDGAHDDQVDATTLAYSKLTVPSRQWRSH